MAGVVASRVRRKREKEAGGERDGQEEVRRRQVKVRLSFEKIKLPIVRLLLPSSAQPGGLSKHLPEMFPRKLIVCKLLSAKLEEMLVMDTLDILYILYILYILDMLDLLEILDIFVVLDVLHLLDLEDIIDIFKY